MSSICFDVYRNEGAESGTTKDWAIGISLNQGIVVVKYGKTGSKLRTNILKTNNPQQEMNERIKKKVAKGYYIVGTSTFSASENTISLDQVKRPNIIWSITGLLDKDDWLDRVKHLINSLTMLNLPELCSFEKGELSISGIKIFDSNSLISGSNQRWSVGGVIKSENSTLPTLIILAVAKRLGTLSFCDDENQPITVEYLGNECQFARPEYSLDFLDDIAIALELKKSPVNLFCSAIKDIRPLIQLNL